MRSSESVPKSCYCEICEQPAVDPVIMGIEVESDYSSLIQLCRVCGVIDLDLMQLCREATIGCASN